MRWYNPSHRGFEWRNIPEDDKEALTILDESVASRSYVEVYWRWRNLGATVMASLIRVGEAAKDADDAKRDEEGG
jgi:hypothetical protein